MTATDIDLASRTCTDTVSVAITPGDAAMRSVRLLLEAAEGLTDPTVVGVEVDGQGVTLVQISGRRRLTADEVHYARIAQARQQRQRAWDHAFPDPPST